MTKKVIIYITGILFSLLFPFLLVKLLIGYLPDAYIISPKLLLAEKNAINIQALEAKQEFGNVERLKITGHKDHVLLTRNQDIIRLVLLEPNQSVSKTIDKSDNDAKLMKNKNGITVVGTESFRGGKHTYKISRFSDGTVSFAQGLTGFVLQIVTKDQEDLKNYFKKIGMVIENKDIHGIQRWLSRNIVTVLVIFLLLYSIIWISGIFKGGAWIAAVYPEQGVQAVPAVELEKRLLRINDLEVPFKILRLESGMYTAEWRLDKKWNGIVESESIKYLFNLNMKLNDRRKTVSVVENKRKLIREKGILRTKVQFDIFRGITFKSYEKAATYGLSYIDGQFKITGYEYKFKVQEIKNPLIEVVIQSGWKWEPHVLML